jgi:hypothetical protein
MNEYEFKLKYYLEQIGSDAEHLSFNQSCHSVTDAAEAVGADPGSLF